MTDLENEIIDQVLLCVEDQTVLKAVLAGKPWPKALGSETGATWEIGGKRGYWHASSFGIKITDEHGSVTCTVRPREIAARAKTITTPDK